MPDLETIGKWAAIIGAVLGIITIVGRWISKYIHFHDCNAERERLNRVIEADGKLITALEKAGTDTKSRNEVKKLLKEHYQRTGENDIDRRRPRDGPVQNAPGTHRGKVSR